MIKMKLIVILLALSSLVQAQTTSYSDATFTEYFRRSKGWISSDATISVPLPNGKVLWLFGDTHLDNLNAATNTVPCLFQVRNSMMVQDAVDRNQFITILDNTKNDINRTPVKMVNNDTTLFWPGHGYVRGDTVTTFWFRYHNTKLTTIGIYAVKMYWPSLTDATAIKSIKKIPVNDAALKYFEFGNAVIADEASNFLYIYGHKKNWVVLEPYLARCPLDNVMGKWEFYDGVAWTTDLSKAKKISDEYVSPSFSAIKLNNKYYIITQENGYLTCGLGRQMFAYSSDTPFGPFVNKKTIWVINDMYKGSYMITYNGTAHPEFNANNELLISYNVNGICPTECKNTWTDRMNADTYRPKFARVPFDVLDNGYSFDPQSVIIASVTSGIPPFKVDFKGYASVGERSISYSWNFGDGSPLVTVRDPSHFFNEKGTFNVELTVKDSKNRTATSSVTIYSVITASKEISSINEEICIYPNPIKDSFVVEIPNFKPNLPTRISISNSAGQEVLWKMAQGKCTTFRLKENGVYYVRITEGEKQTVLKIIKQE